MQNYPPVERARPGASRAFTLIEIIIAVAILTVILLMAVPSLEGVFADRKLRASLDGFNKLVREAQERSVSEHRAYLIVWGEKDVIVQPEAFAKGEEKKAVATFALERQETLDCSRGGSASRLKYRALGGYAAVLVQVST